MTQPAIRAILMAKLATFAAAHSPVLTIAREGIPFTKPADDSAFLEAILTPANTTNPSSEATRKRFHGDFQINVWTKDNIGPGSGEAIAEEIIALFPVVPKSLLPVSIEQTPSIRAAILDQAGWRVIPVTMMYRAEY